MSGYQRDVRAPSPTSALHAGPSTETANSTPAVAGPQPRFIDRIGAMMGWGGQSSGTPTLELAGLETQGGPQGGPGPDGGLKVFPGYDADWHQSQDALITRIVAEFNAERGFEPDHPHYLDPNLAKAWALQESGGHKDIFTGGDMMQMNNTGDWAKEKTWFGLTKGEKVDPEKSLRVALEWAWYKGEVTKAKKNGELDAGWHDTQRGTQAVPGYQSRFTGWENALTNYNGGGVDDYWADIDNRHDRGRDPLDMSELDAPPEEMLA